MQAIGVEVAQQAEVEQAQPSVRAEDAVLRVRIAGDGAVTPDQPEALVYEPQPDNTLKLVAAEYVVDKAQWDASHPDKPSLFGQTFMLTPAGNRYGLPDFYELHVWVWKGNPRGVFHDWNPTVSCRGNGDAA
jgi:hypothetical protein